MLPGRKGDLIKVLWHDGVGMSLYLKRLEAGKFVWPVSQNGSAVPVSAAQLACTPLFLLGFRHAPW
ncbi:transposase [Rhizobium leguminosarum]|nr:transposase [Rhizobium leguminosarum]MBY2937516.1 transposase [Rhizobium leguminosarum]